MIRRALITLIATAIAASGLAFLTVEPAAAKATLFTWTGGSPTKNWSIGANWQGGVAPSGSASIYIPSGSGTMTMDIAPANISIDQMSVYGTWNIQGNQIRVATDVFVGPGSTVDFQGGLASPGPRLDLDVGTNQGFNTTATISGPLDVTGLFRINGWDNDVSKVFIKGTTDNHVDVMQASNSTLTLDKPAGVQAARRVNAYFRSIVIWNADRQLNDPVAASPTSPEFTQPMIDAEAGEVRLNGHTEVVNKLYIDGGGKIDLGTNGDLAAEAIRTGFANAGRSDITGGTLRFSAPLYDTNNAINIGNAGTDPVDVHVDSKLLGSTTIRVDGGSDRIPLIRFAKGNQYTGDLRVTTGTVCAALGMGGTVSTEGNGVYIDERNETCVARLPIIRPSSPRNFTAQPGDRTVTLSWQAPSNPGSAPLQGYRLSRSIGSNEAGLIANLGPNDTAYVDSELTNGTDYHYTLTAYSTAGNSDPVEASATPQEVQIPPGPPVLFGVAGDASARLEWDVPVEPGNFPITEYNLYRTDDPDQDGPPDLIYQGPDRAYLDTGLDNGTLYYYRVAAVSGGLQGSSSDWFTLTPAANSGQLGLSFEQLTVAYPGRNAVVRLVASNRSTDPLVGPFTATVMLPANVFGIAASGGGGWTCAAPRVLGSRSLVTCTNPSGLPGNSELAPLNLTLAVPSGTARASYPISYSMAAPGRAASSDKPYQLVVANPKPAALTLAVGAPGNLSATDPQDVTLQVKNVGSGSTVGRLTLTMPVPSGVTLNNLRTDPFWTCSLATSLLSCTSDRSLSAGSPAPAIVLAATAPATEKLTTYLLYGTIRGFDAFRSLVATSTARTAAPVIPKPDFSVEPTTNDDSTFRFTAENIGGAPATGYVLLTLQLPSPYITVDQLSDIATWSCTRSGTIYTCKSPEGITVAPGEKIQGPLLSASAEFGDGSGHRVTTLSGTYAAHISATFRATNGKTYKTVSTPTPIPLFLDPPQPALTVQGEWKDAPLLGQHHSSITFSLKGAPQLAYTDRAPLVLLLPPSLILDGTAIPSLAGYPAGTAAPQCEIRPGRYPGGFANAVVCLLDASTPANAAMYINVPFTTVEELGGTVTALVGTVRRPSALTTPTAILDHVWSRVTARGGAALANSTEPKVNGLTFTVDAGPPQRVDSGVVGTDGVIKPTRVAMAGLSNLENLIPLNFGWVQTAGPKVTWESARPNNGGADQGTPPAFPTGYKFAGGTVSVPDVFGKKPAFIAPAVTEHTEFVFELYVTDGKGVAKSVTTVAVDPLADNPPTVSSVKLTDAGGTVLDPTVTPAAGTELQLRYTTADPEKDPVAVVPQVVRPGELRNTTFTPVAGAPANQSWFAFKWPEGATQVVVEAVLTDGKTDPTGNAVSSRHSFVVGPDPSPLGIGLSPPTTGIDPGGTLSLTATLTNPVVGPDSTTIMWSQLSGPESTLTPSGSTVQLRAPPTAKPGDSITIQALARRGTGSAAPVAVAKVTVAVVALDALKLGAVRTSSGALPASVAPSSTTPLTLPVSGGKAPYTYAWQVLSGGGSLTGTTTSTASFTAPASPGLVAVVIDVTDASGATARQLAAIPVGTVPSGTLGAQGCDVGGPLRTIFDAASGLSDSDHVVVKFGSLNIDLGTKGTLLGGSTTCEARTLAISGGAATVSGVGFTNINGSVNALGVTISSATVTLPAAWRLTNAQLSDVRFNFTDYAFSGSITASSVPVLATTGAVTQGTTTLTLGKDRFTLSASAKLAGANVSLAGVYCFSDKPACTGPPAGVVGPVPPGAFAIHATAGSLRFLDKTLTGGGDLTLAADGTLAGAVELAWTGAASGQLGINDVRIRWTNAGLRFHAGATLGSKFAASLDGDYLDEDDWSADVSGGLASDWTPAPGLTLAKYVPGAGGSPGTGTGVEGSVAMKGGHLSWAVTLRAGTSWSTGPLTIRGMTLSLGSGGDAPAGCRLTTAQQQSTYLDVKGIGEISWGASGGSPGKKVQLNVETCIVPDVGWTLTTTAPLTGVQIANGLDLTGVTFTAAYTKSPAQTSYVLNATGTAFGVSGAVSLALLSPSAGDSSFIADMMVNLDDLGVPVSGEGHLIYASRAISDLGAIKGLDAGFANHSTPSAPGACGGSTPASPLSGLPAPAGFTALANFKAPTSLCSFLKSKIGVPVSPSLVVSVNLAGTPVITASISTGPTGYKVFSTDDGTRLDLRRIKLSISLGGSFGLMADADLTLAKPTGNSVTDTTVLSLSAGVTIQLAGVPSITVSLSKTGDAWNDAFGVPGLMLGDLAIQGGVVFSAIPTPSIGFAAQILDMPTRWKNVLGIINDPSTGRMEPVQLGLNISLSNPILDIRLGTYNGRDFMRPLRGISTSLENAIKIDYAQLTIAPFGGDIGPFHYTPGFHIGFAMKLLGVPLDMKADLDMASGKFAASAKIGAFGFGPVQLSDTTFAMEISPANAGFSASFSSGFKVGSIKTTAVAGVSAKLVSGVPKFKLDFDANLGGVTLGPVTLNQLKVFAHADLSGAAAILSPLSEGMTFGATATISVLTVPMTVYGTVTLSTYGGVTGGDLLVTTGAFNVGVASVGGSGCRTSVLGYLPAGVTVPTNGPCLQVGLHPLATSNQYFIKASGSLGVLGLTAKFDGTVDNTGIAMTASVQISSAATVSISGRLWAGPGINGTQTDWDPTKGRFVTVRNGDFRISGNSSVNLLAFHGSVNFEFGNIGGSQFALGKAKFDVLKGGASPLSFSASLAGSFSRNSSGFHWNLSANGTFYVAGFRVAGALVRFTESSFAVSGSLAAGPVTANLNASLFMNNGVRFNFTGSGSIRVLNFGISSSVTISNTSGSLYVNATANLEVGVLKLHTQAWFDTSGGICVWGKADVGFGNGNWSNLANISASFCTKSFNNLPAGIHASAWVLDSIGLEVDWTDITHFTGIGGVNVPTWKVGGVVCFVACGGAEASFGGFAYLAVSSHGGTRNWAGHNITFGPGLSFRTSAAVHIRGCILACASVDIGFDVSFNPTRFCVTWAKVTVCLSLSPLSLGIDW